jgi:hypothetical protein
MEIMKPLAPFLPLVFGRLILDLIRRHLGPFAEIQIGLPAPRSFMK